MSGSLADLLAVLPLVSIVWGNLAAIRQQSYRPMIAYSSIAHAGYLFYAFLGDAAGRMQAGVFYVVPYSVVNLLAIAAMPDNELDADRDRLDTVKGLWHHDRLVAAAYSTYAVLGLVGSYIGIYFYVRVIMLMFMNAGEASPSERSASTFARSASVLCVAGTALLAIPPGWVLERFWPTRANGALA